MHSWTELEHAKRTRMPKAKEQRQLNGSHKRSGRHTSDPSEWRGNVSDRHIRHDEGHPGIVTPGEHLREFAGSEG